MKKLFFVLVVSVLVWSCGGGPKKTQEPEPEPEVVEVVMLTVDGLMASAEDYLDTEVTLQGLCMHVCNKDGSKLVLQGNDEGLFVFATGDTEFDPELEGELLLITGTFTAYQAEEGHECEKALEANYKLDCISFEIVLDEVEEVIEVEEE